MADSNRKAEPGKTDSRVPIVIAITGHRDLISADVPKIEQVLTDFLSRLQLRFSNSPFVFLSSLAEGADQLGARVALKIGMSLVCPLPFALEEYEKDFGNAESLEKFRDLLAQSSAHFPVYTPPTDAESRVACYARAGAYLAWQSSILIALWDGKESAKRGGTADVVSYRLKGIPPELESDWDPMDIQQRRALFVINTPRIQHQTAIENPFLLAELSVHGRPTRENEFTELRSIDAYNSERPVRKQQVEDELEVLVSSADCPEPLLSRLKALSRMLNTAGCLADKYQIRSRRIFVAILLFGFISAISTGQMHRFNAAWLFLVPVTASSLAYAIYFFGMRRGRMQIKHEDYRALAEALRVQFYWTLSGIGERVSKTFLRSSSVEVCWIRFGVRNCTAALPLLPSASTAERLKLVLDNWILDQKQYFERAFKAQFSKNLALSNLKALLLLVAVSFKMMPDLLAWLHVAPSDKTVLLLSVQIIFAVSLILFQIRTRLKELKDQQNFLKAVRSSDPTQPLGIFYRSIGFGCAALLLLSIVTALILFAYNRPEADADTLAFYSELVFVIAAAAAGTIHLYGHVLGFSEQAKTYARMFSIFDHAEHTFRESLEAGRLAEAQIIERSLGREALNENQSWLELHRSRPIEVPKR